MLKFFRKIRFDLIKGHRVNRYILYAAGEILLVVVGILIALQINNWNETKKSIRAERELLSAVLENIKTDSLSLDSLLRRTETIIETHKELIGFSKGILTVEQIGNLDAVRRSEPNQLVTKKNNPNLSNQVRDLGVKKIILDYYLEIDWLNFTISNNNEIIEQRVRPFLGERRLLNYGNQFNETSDQMNLVNRSKFIEEFKKDELKQLLFESGLKINIMQRVANRTLLKNQEVKKVISSYLKGYD
ncbi:DUF6090 family protein [Portibacter marinus]|uniref:DUF6090 family protein n=1 Tax=Portibacter marinus TaxID=2898660 RepID=UPI001F4708FD|nr:DUF6090 family protein [Portibacter marinus]